MQSGMAYKEFRGLGADGLRAVLRARGVVANEEMERREQSGGAASPVVVVNDELIMAQMALLPPPPHGAHEGPLPVELAECLELALEIGLLESKRELQRQAEALQSGSFDAYFFSALRNR